MIRRLVKFFCDLETSKNFKSCCDLLCVAKTCYFLKTFYDKRDSDSKAFHEALETLKLSSPCGQDLWRVLDDFLQCCFRIFRSGHKNIIEEKVRALQKACSKCKKATQSGKSCSCCSSSSPSSCQACKDLLQDSELKTLFLHGYVSSYDSKDASWPDCKSKSGSCCQPSCLKCPSSGSCPSNGCCEKCPKRLCAKIFLGMLPCLYFGLKILYDRCKDPVTWPDWHDISILSDKPSSGLAKFLQAWGYDVRPLISKKGSEFFSLLENLFTPDSKGSLDKIYNIVSKEYFPRSPSSGSKDPSTVRQMLLWFYGLPFTSGFHDLVLHCKSLCLPFGNSFNADAFCYYIHTCSFILPVAIISFIEDSSSAQTAFSSSSEWKSFYYPSDPSALADMLFKYIRKIYIPLSFLRFQCSRNPDQAGWQYCWYGKDCKVEPLSSGSVSSSSSGSCSSCKYSGAYLCTGQPSGTDDAHDHCVNGHPCVGFDSSGSSGSCSSHSSANCKPCPHPLQRFLVDGSSESKSNSNSNSQAYPFGLSGIVPMGFSKENLSSTARDGWSLYHVLKVFCKDGFYPLTRLLQFSLCVSRYPPETLGELFAFFFRFSESDVFKNFGDYVDGEPGRYPGKALQDAVRALYGSEDSHKNSSHPSDLRSLIACDGPKGSSGSPPTCGKYLHPLTYNAYNNKNFIEDFLDTYLSWVCHLTKDFEKKLKDFHHEASKKFKSCCSTGSCQKIVHCPCALPFLYSFGFGFWGPKTLNTNNKKCSDFIDQLGKVLGLDSHGSVAPIKNLLRIIDEFIWHIRLPFIYAFLY
ncbi:variant erythrocyte surface antigen-1 family protein, partial [Babesia divergens]